MSYCLLLGYYDIEKLTKINLLRFYSYLFLLKHKLTCKIRYSMENKGEIILYQPDEAVRLEVRLEDETVWLTQAQMAELFQTSKQNVSLHTNNIFKEKELSPNLVVKDSLTTATDGKKYRSSITILMLLYP